MTLTESIPDDRNEFAKIESVYRYLKKARSPATFNNWKYSLYDFFEFAKIHPDQFIKLDNSTKEDIIETYVDYLKGRVNQNEVNPNSIITLVNPLKKFLIFNRVENMSDAWIRIKANFPDRKRSTDEKYDELELQKMYNIASFREKAILGLLLSGMRKGAIKDLKFKDITTIEDWAAIRVYADTNEEYHSFVTPQGLQSIRDYDEYRKRNGEKITGDSPLIRNEFRPEHAGEWTDECGKKHFPEAIHSDSGISEIIINLVRKAGVATNSHNFKTRHKTMTCHGFRKYFNTICKTSGMDSERVEMLMGHANSSLSGHYWRLPTNEAGMSPQEQKMFQTIKNEFQRCIPELTIGESEVLRMKNKELEETVNESLKEKDYEINSLQRQISKMRENPFIDMSPQEMEQFFDMLKDWKELKKQLPATT